MIRTLISAAAVAAVLMTAGPAFAADDEPAPEDFTPHGADGNWTGSTVSGPGTDVSPDEQAQADAKMAGLAEWWTYDAADQPTLARRALANRLEPSIASRMLPIEHVAQQTNFYCGPASGRMILKLIASGASAFDGSGASQSSVANANHMRTDINGATEWTSHLFKVGLNRWYTGASDGFFVDTGSPSTAYFKDVLRVDVQNNGTGFGADTVEFAGGSHYNNHPIDRTIGHWLVASGFANYGGSTRFHDPSTSVYGGAQPTFQPNTGTFVSTYLPYNGITW